jgi:hypothetical protein
MADTERPTTRRTGGRIPPHNWDAERSCLGAMLISTDAGRAAVRTGLTVNDFHKPAHQFIYKAIADFVELDIPYDPLLVGDELRADGLLDQIGGKDYLDELFGATPSLSNVARYAKIVQDTATLRRVIDVGTDIAELGFRETDDIVGAIAEAEAKLLALTDSIGADDDIEFVDMAAVLAGSLEPVQPSMLLRTDGRALIYSARLNVLQGSPASGKTWVSRMVALQVINGGGHVMVLDWEDTAQAFVAGLLALGAHPDDIREFVHFLKPDSSHSNARILKAVKKLSIELLIIDSVAEALNFCGLSEDKPDEYLAWLAQLPRQAANAGTTVIMLDHIVKSKDEQGFWARGTGAKLGACDGATYNVKSSGFNQITSGNIYLTVAKDRPGGLPARQGEKAAKIWMNPSDGGRIIQALIETPPPEQTSTVKAQAKDHERASQREAIANRILEVLDSPMNQRELLAVMRSNRGSGPLVFTNSHVPDVLVDLVDTKAITLTMGKNKSNVYAPPPRQQRLATEAPEQ